MEDMLVAWTFAVAAAVGLVGVYVYVVRPRHLTWGATDEEVAAPLPL